ncbi:diaminopimelate epimerase [Luteibacter sp. 329MFSha]|uniref:diaminopimelate epimerase n=1 Tax=Luteibacter sp. 329MFSha TaxID=1798239 RepID=UPI0008CFD3B9|nr:diaminopimelate epimerase [Luteibacter sp. 329MFSha]SEW23869.1 diaminopimelate epimerase [Luteibacter sp. 329MFSha]
MPSRFTKMHGIGNDFVIVDWREDAPRVPNAARVAALADRHTGIGFDQLISIEPARDPSCAFYYGIWNADGSPSGQCGNGVRCVAAWLFRDGAIERDTDVRLESPSGPVVVRVLDENRVVVDMGEPDFDPAHVPLDRPAHATYTVSVDGEDVSFGAVSMGNPHGVAFVDDVADPRVDRLGPLLTAHPVFPQGANIGFAQRLGPDLIRLRVHERGSGWTQACGTGACAAAAVAQSLGLATPVVGVELPGGTLTIEWHGPGHTLWMTGPAAFVFEGEV